MVEKRTGVFVTEEDIASLPGVASVRPIASRRISEVCIDSRKCIPDSLFVPLKGEHTDGHFFISDALQAGAGMVLVEKDYWSSKANVLQRSGRERNIQFFLVDDTLSALQKIAANHLRSLPRITTIGITGSNGKTTTKEILYSILNRAMNVVANEGNLNSEIGLCLAAFKVGQDHEVAVFEMGMNRKGEMDVLADIVRPDLAVITNIGTAHIGLLGSTAAIAEEKKKITAYFSGEQTLFLHEQDPYYSFLSNGINGTVVPFGPKSLTDLHSIEDCGLKGMRIEWKTHRITVPLIGMYNLLNCTAAMTVAKHLGVDDDDIVYGLENVKPLFGRSQVIEGQVTVIQDCYNANAESVTGALKYFDNLPWHGRKMAVIGSMKELGEFSEDAHQAVGKLLASSSCHYVFFFGEETRVAKKTFEENVGQAETEKQSFWFADYHRLEQEVCSRVRPGDLVLLKGSRAVALERLGSMLVTVQGEEKC